MSTGVAPTLPEEWDGPGNKRTICSDTNGGPHDDEPGAAEASAESAEEELVYLALLAKADELPPYDSLMVSPQQWAFVRGRWFRLDLQVVYRGHTLAVEVDDPSHHGRYAADRSRDELIRDCGGKTVRLPLEAVLDPAELDTHVHRILMRLGCQRRL